MVIHIARSFDLDNVAALENDQFQIGLTHMRDVRQIGERVSNLYGRLADALERGPAAPLERDARSMFLANIFLRAAQRSALLELLDIARTHYAESHAKRRRCVDLVAFTWIAWSATDADDKWINARDDFDAYAIAFKNFRIAGALDALGPDLKDLWKSLSGHVHPSLQSLALSIRTPERDKTPGPRVDICDTLADELIPFPEEFRAEIVLDAALCHSTFLEALHRRLFTDDRWCLAREEFWAQFIAARDELQSAARSWEPRIERMDAFRTEQRLKLRAARSSGRIILPARLS